MDAEFARFVGAGGNHAALITRRADDDRQPFEFGMVVHFDRREKGVHVDVEDGSFRHWGKHRDFSHGDNEGNEEEM